MFEVRVSITNFYGNVDRIDTYIVDRKDAEETIMYIKGVMEKEGRLYYKILSVERI